MQPLSPPTTVLHVVPSFLGVSPVHSVRLSAAADFVAIANSLVPLVIHGQRFSMVTKRLNVALDQLPGGLTSNHVLIAAGVESLVGCNDGAVEAKVCGAVPQSLVFRRVG